MPRTELDVLTQATKIKVNNDFEEEEEDVGEYSLEDSLGLIGFGKAHFEVLFACALVLLEIINESMVSVGIITIASQCDFDTNSQEKAIMSAAVYVGLIVAAYPWGYYADTSGRKTVMIQATIIAAGFSFLSMLVTNLLLFVFLRFLTGVAIAGASSALYPYLGEFNTLAYRPLVINYVTVALGVGCVYPAGIYNLLLKTKQITTLKFRDD